MRQRKLNRYFKHNYAAPGYYFVTICTKDRLPWFGEINKGCMQLNEYGKIADLFCQNIPSHFTCANVCEYAIMPDHIHCLIGIVAGSGLCRGGRSATPTQANNAFTKRDKMTLSKIVHGFKSSVTRHIRKNYNENKFSWQRSYHDSIIFNKSDLERVAKYIRDNPNKPDRAVI